MDEKMWKNLSIPFRILRTRHGKIIKYIIDVFQFLLGFYLAEKAKKYLRDVLAFNSFQDSTRKQRQGACDGPHHLSIPFRILPKNTMSTGTVLAHTFNSFQDSTGLRVSMYILSSNFQFLLGFYCIMRRSQSPRRAKTFNSFQDSTALEDAPVAARLHRLSIPFRILLVECPGHTTVFYAFNSFQDSTLS